VISKSFFLDYQKLEMPQWGGLFEAFDGMPMWIGSNEEILTVKSDWKGTIEVDGAVL